MGEWSTKTPKYTFHIPGEENGYAVNRAIHWVGLAKVFTLIVTIIMMLIGLGAITTFKDLARKDEVSLSIAAARDSAMAESTRVYQTLKSGQDSLQTEMKMYHEAVSKQLEAIDKKLWNLNRKRGEEQ